MGAYTQAGVRIRGSGCNAHFKTCVYAFTRAPHYTQKQAAQLPALLSLLGTWRIARHGFGATPTTPAVAKGLKAAAAVSKFKALVVKSPGQK